MTKDEKIDLYKKKIQGFRQKTNTAEAKKDLLAQDLIKAKKEYNDYNAECLEKYKCTPQQLKNEIKSVQSEIENLLKEAETILDKIEKGNTDDAG